MNKKDYQKPTLLVLTLQHQSQLLAGSGGVTGVGGGTVGYGGASSNNTSGQIRSRGGSVWEDDDE